MDSESDFFGINFSDALVAREQVRTAMINGVPILEGGYAQYKHGQLHIGGGIAEKQCPFTSEFLCEDSGKESFKDAFPKIKDACIELSKKVNLSNGYSIVLENLFAYDEYETFFGLFLTILDSKKADVAYSKRSHLISEELHKCTVGVLGFKVGFPFVVHTLQGNNGKAPQEFYLATGKTFDEVLLQRMIGAVGCTMNFSSDSQFRKIPRIAFNFYDVPSKKMENRLLQLVPRKYYDEQKRRQLCGARIPEVYVRNRFLARANRNQAVVAKTPMKI